MRRKILIALALLGIGALAVWWFKIAPKNFPASAPARAKTELAAPVVSTTPAATAASNPDAVASIPVMLPAEIARVVGENAQPGRMVFVQLQFADGLVTATRAVGAAGRAKPGPVQRGLGHLQYEIYSDTGELTLSGSAEDPLHQRFEYEDETQPGTLRAMVIDRPTGSLDLRLPGEARAARILFFRENASGREPAGEVILR